MSKKTGYDEGPFRTVYKPGSKRMIHNRLLNVLETYKDMDIVLEDDIFKVYIIEEGRLLKVTHETYSSIRSHEKVNIGHVRSYIDFLRSKDPLYANLRTLN